MKTVKRILVMFLVFALTFGMVGTSFLTAQSDTVTEESTSGSTESGDTKDSADSETQNSNGGGESGTDTPSTEGTTSETNSGEGSGDSSNTSNPDNITNNQDESADEVENPDADDTLTTETTDDTIEENADPDAKKDSADTDLDKELDKALLKKAPATRGDGDSGDGTSKKITLKLELTDNVGEDTFGINVYFYSDGEGNTQLTDTNGPMGKAVEIVRSENNNSSLASDSIDIPANCQSIRVSVYMPSGHHISKYNDTEASDSNNLDKWAEESGELLKVSDLENNSTFNFTIAKDEENEPEPPIVLFGIKCDTAVIAPDKYSLTVKLYNGSNNSTTEIISKNTQKEITIPTECTKVGLTISCPDGYYVWQRNDGNTDDNGEIYEETTSLEKWKTEAIFTSINEFVGNGPYCYTISSNKQENKLPTYNNSHYELYIYDNAAGMRVAEVGSSDPWDSFTDLDVMPNCELRINRNYTIKGTLRVLTEGYLRIAENCTLNAGSFDFQDSSFVIFGNETSATGFKDKLKQKNSDETTSYNGEINNTLFRTVRDDKGYIFLYVDESIIDCGFQLNTDNSINDNNNQSTLDYVKYTITNGEQAETAANFTALGDWTPTTVDSSKIKEGTKVTFEIKTKEGYKLSNTGVRFIDPVNPLPYDNGASGDSGIYKVTYTYTSAPKQYGILYFNVIKSEVEESNDAILQWTNDLAVLAEPGGRGGDYYVDHGRIEVVKVTNSSGNELNNSNESGKSPYWNIDNAQFNMGGRLFSGSEMLLAKDTKVELRLVPDRGYQLTSFKINNSNQYVTVQGDLYTYTFTVPSPGQVVFGATFTPVSDKVEVTTDKISGGSFSYNGSAVDSGSMVLKVENTSTSTNETFKKQADNGGYTVDQVLGLSSEQRIYKGVANPSSANDYWAETKSNLGSPATITLNVNPNSITGEDVVVLHKKSDDSIEEIPATYSNGQVTFKTSSFSDYAIASREKKITPMPIPSAESKYEEQQEESTDTTNVTPPIGATVNGAVVNDWDDMKNVLLTTPKSTPIDDKTPAVNPLTMLTLTGFNTNIPKDVFDAMSVSNSSGMHVFLGNATALTFLKPAVGMNTQEAVDVSCITKLDTKARLKTITFKKNTKLSVPSLLHATVPKGVKKVTVYFIGADGIRRLLGEFEPTVDGHVGFAVAELGKFEIKY